MKRCLSIASGVFVLLLHNITFAQTANVSTTEASKNVQQAAISISGSGPFHRLNLPVSIYPTAAYMDLRDVRIRNASGDMVPYAWLDNDVAAPQIVSADVAFYPIAVQKNNNAKDQADVSLAFKQNADGSLLTLQTNNTPQDAINSDWIIDVSQLKGSLLQARFELGETVNGLFALSIEASDDLQHWRTLNSDAQIAVLTQPSGKIEKLTVDLFSAQTKYLRLHWRDATPLVTIKAIAIDAVQQNLTDSPLQWSDAITATRCTQHSCDYLLPEKTPIDSVRINLSEPNTLAEVSVYGQLPVQASTDYPHRHRPLYVLRHKRQAPVSVSATDVMLAKALAYRLTYSNEELYSDNVEMDGKAYTQLRLQTQGPITLLGKVAPSIEVASMPRSLLFLARGSAPFTLLWGAEAVQGSALALTTLVPGYQPNTPVHASNASVDISPPIQKSTAVPALNTELTSSKHIQPQAKKEWLWAVLAGGLLLLVGMAWSLFSSMAKSKP